MLSARLSNSFSCLHLHNIFRPCLWTLRSLLGNFPPICTIWKCELMSVCRSSLSELSIPHNSLIRFFDAWSIFDCESPKNFYAFYFVAKFRDSWVEANLRVLRREKPNRIHQVVDNFVIWNSNSKHSVNTKVVTCCQCCLETSAVTKVKTFVPEFSHETPSERNVQKMIKNINAKKSIEGKHSEPLITSMCLITKTYYSQLHLCSTFICIYKNWCVILIVQFTTTWQFKSMIIKLTL